MSGPAANRGLSPFDGRPTWADVGAAFEAGLGRTKSDRGRTALRRVHDAIGALRDAGAAISFQAVGAWCVARHAGPVAQSVQNNERTADLVRVAISVQSADIRPHLGRPVEVRLLEQIGNLELRSELEALLAHRRALITEVNGLRLAIRRVRALSFLTGEMAEAGLDRLEQLEARILEWRRGDGRPVFSKEQRAACRAFLDEGLAVCRLIVDEPSGEILDRSLRTIARRGVASALRVVASSGPA